MAFDYRSVRQQRRPDISDPNDPTAPSFMPPVGNFQLPDFRQTLRGLVGPRLDRSIFSTGATRLGGGGGGLSAPDQPDVVPGPFGVYQEDKGRPFEQVGKFGVNLMPSVGTRAPGGPSPYEVRPENPLQETGFFEGLFGGIAGFTGNEGIANVGRTIGSAVDLPLEATGNIVGLPGALLSAAPIQFREGGLDPEIEAMYQQAVAENPINGILMWSHAAKAQWEKDVAEGRMTGLMADVGPAVAATDQLGLLIQLLLAKPQQGVQRIATSIFGEGPMESIEKVEAAARSSGSEPGIQNAFYQGLQERLERGDFGEIGSQRARDLMLDEVVLHNATLRDAGDPDQEGIITGQGLADIGLSLVTDPWLILGGIGGLASTGLRAGMGTASAKFLSVFPEAQRTGIVSEMVDAARRIGGFDTPERALVSMNKDADLRYRAMQEVATSHPEQAQEAAAAATYLQRWGQTWEPALRPLINTVRAINDPQRLFGVGQSGKVAETVFSSNATEGVIRSYGLDNHVDLTDTLNALPSDVGPNFTRGLGVYVGNSSRVYFRNGLIRDARLRTGVPFTTTPDDIITQRMTGARGSDLATGLEQQNLRFMPQYLATEQGGAAAALVRGQSEAAQRLQLMGAGLDESTEIAGKLNREQIAEIDAAYFGYATDQFLKAKAAAVASRRGGPLKPGVIDPDELTILGPRQMTMQNAEQVLDSVKRGAAEEVHVALRQYDVLFENLSENMSDTDLLKAVRDILTDLTKNKALPSDLTDTKGLSKALRGWAADNADLGYRPGYRPDQMWRPVYDDKGKLLAVSPWTELAGTAADVATYGRWDRAKEMLFHNIRGERIVADARIALAKYTTDRFGFTRAQSDALFARIVKLASESGITPRGMSPEQIYNLFTSAKLSEKVLEGIGPREAIEAVMQAFEGSFRRVGVTQKFTGTVKTGLGGQSNWIGQMSERIYPTVRFALNPLFQAQELVEPYILNLMRGIKPGWKASDLDKQTLKLVEDTIRQGRYVYDDQIERSEVLLWGADVSRQALGPTTKLGKIIKLVSFGGRINVKEVKKVNYARALRRKLGDEFEESFNRAAPDLLPALRGHYGTADMGEIAVRWLTEKATWSDGGRKAQQAIMDAAKPSDFGARSQVNLDNLIALFDGIDDVAALRTAVRSGSISEDIFRDALRQVGGDDDFAGRAWVTSRAPLTADQWWDEFRDTLTGGNATAASKARTMLRQRAETLGISEEEFLARVMSREGSTGLPGLVDDQIKVEGALQSTDPFAAIRVLADIFGADLDPSQRNIILDAFWLATGSRETAWSQKVADWWADQFRDYAIGPSRPTTRPVTELDVAAVEQYGFHAAGRRHPSVHLEEAFESARPLAEATAFYRRISASRAEAIRAEAEYIDNGYMSVAGTPEQTLPYQGADGVTVRVEVPKGVRAIDVDEVMTHPAAMPIIRERRLSGEFVTGERILPFGGRYTVRMEGDDIVLSLQASPAGRNPRLRGSYEYLRRVVGKVDATQKAREAKAILSTERDAAVVKAQGALAKVAAPAKQAEKTLAAARRAMASARKELDRVRRRTTLDTLEQRWGDARAAVTAAEERVRAVKQGLAGLEQEVKQARTRAEMAAGTRSAGGLTAVIGRRQAAVDAGQQHVKAAERALAQARRNAQRAAADARGARRRTPITRFEQKVMQASKAVEKAKAKAVKARDQMKVAQRALDDAKALPVRAKGKQTLEVPEVSSQMRTLMDSILNPPDRSVMKTGPGSPIDIGTSYDLQEEAAYQAARFALSRAEENAFTLHYYKRGRNFLERSINHPYFGLYPASYMWGKVLPELVRFLVKTPFGIDAPLGGLALSNNIYRQVMVQQQFDEDFRQQMIERTDMFHLLALLTPALPWEIPVNAPLWTRRVAEADATHVAELAAGDVDSPMMDPDQFAKMTEEMLTYAFGPAQVPGLLVDASSAAFGLGGDTFNVAADTVNRILSQGQQGPPVAPGVPTQPGLPPQGVPNVDTYQP